MGRPTPKWYDNKRILGYADLALILISVCLLYFIRPDILVETFTIIGLLYLTYTRRTHLYKPIALAFLVALVWTIAARGFYSYNLDMVYVFGVALFPLFAWTMGLFALLLITSIVAQKANVRQPWPRFALFVSLYWPLLMLVEILGYHVFHIKNQVNVFSGLPLCDCLHGPWWVKVAYFSLGIIYYGLCVYLNIENLEKRKSA